MPFTRRTLIARAAHASGAAVVASAVPPAALARPHAPTIEVAPWPPLRLPDPPLRAADYLGVADEVVRRLTRTWVAEERAYSAGGGGIDATYNAALLTIHAIAAERGHDGPARNDERARLLAARLCESPPFFTGTALPNPDTMFHTPGWVGNLDVLDSPMDKIMLSLTAFADELEREKARQRTYDAMQRKARAGHVTGGRATRSRTLRRKRETSLSTEGSALTALRIAARAQPRARSRSRRPRR